MATRVLSEALEKTGRYSSVDLVAFGFDVAATAPRYRCGNCFLSAARRARAAFAVVSVVHKVSSLISSMDIWIFDATAALKLDISVARFAATSRVDGLETELR
jgi:hypothetical protein